MSEHLSEEEKKIGMDVMAMAIIWESTGVI